MKLPDGTTLMHGSVPYDPVKAREYYLRTRKLKGRKKGVARPPKGKVRRPRKSFTVTVDGKTYKLSPRQLAEQKAYAQKRVTGIKKKLTQLNAELKKRMAEARKKDTEAKKPDSAAEKSEKAKDSEKYRDKNQQELKNKSKKAASEEKSAKKAEPDSVEALKKTIAGAQKNLKVAINRQRALSTATTKN